MDKLKMKTKSISQENVAKIQALFPNAVTEVIKDGKATLAVDFDVLKQELSESLIDGKQERYQMTWPDKKKSIVLANSAIAAALRPCKDESVDFDNTQNLYIEGDNLDVLKLLRETYLGKVKMIYIDPPYNTGNDFLYNDDFSQDSDEYMENSGQYDEQGNRLVKNLDSNGRFHTDWLNMIYPRLKVAKDLLSDDGVIFISIDDNEIDNLKKVCNEVFGASSFVSILNWKGRGGRQDSKYYAAVHEYILCYAKSKNSFIAGEELKSGDIYPKYDEQKKRYYKTQLLRKWGSNSRREDRPNLYYPIKAPDGSDLYPIVREANGQRPSNLTKFDGRWRWAPATMTQAISDGRVEFLKTKDREWIAYEKIFAPLEGEEKTKKYTTWIEETNDGANVIKDLFGKIVFDYSKSPSLIKRFLEMGNVRDDDLILDFFSGSATTAHAVMQLNAEDGGNRKFIMVQLPEPCDEKSEAYKAGYKNICEIGKERIRRTGAKIKQENGLTAQNLDIGFRVLKLDSSNMQDVYYNPGAMTQNLLEATIDNIKPDRTPMDLLFQVMLELGVELSAKIEERETQGKKYYIVNDNDIIACFDDDLNNDVITEIAKLQPLYAVFKDKSFATDSVGINNEQIFKTYSPTTTVKVI